MNKQRDKRIKPGDLRTVFLSIDREDLAHDVIELVRILAGRCAVEEIGRGTPTPRDAREAALCVVVKPGVVQADFTWSEGRNGAQASLDTFDPRQEILAKRSLRWAYKKAVYEAMRPAFATRTPWGSLTGIRPSKLVRTLQKDAGLDEAIRRLRRDFDVSQEKADLVADIVRRQEHILRGLEPKDCDLYVGIPFCRTRCQYCSFAAYALETQEGRKGVPVAKKEAYLACLLEDIRINLRALREAGWRLRSVYVGGGTPTAIERAELQRILECIAVEGDGYGLEFSVEAGRPDTIDDDMLCMLRDMGVTRLSINPQTMNDVTLEAIGRKHSAQDVIRAYDMARKHGFDNINMDVILGLPGEDVSDFARTMEAIEVLAPEGLTVHALAIKRASRLREQLREGDVERLKMGGEMQAARMQDAAAQAAARMGMEPYYMYRQKYSAGNLENVGYAHPGKECIYNVDIMEECCAILALGAGAISKWLYEGDRLVRFANPKDLDTYCAKSKQLNRGRIALWKGQEG